MAWLRRVRVVVVPPSGKGLEFAELFIEGRVARSYKLTENTAEITIHNVSESTRNDVLVKGANAEVYAGYEDGGGAGLIFKGNVTRVKPERTPTGYKVQLTISTIRGSELVNSSVTLSYAPGAQLLDVVRELAAAYDLTLYGEANAASITLPNGFAEAGSIRQALAHVEHILKDNGCGVYRDNNEIVIFKQGQPSFFDIINLTYETGLISINAYEETEAEKKAATGSDARARAQQADIITLLYPEIRVNGLLQITGVSPSLDGQYIPTATEYTFDNEQGPFNVIIRADKVA